MFEIKKVSKQYNGAFALQDVSLNIGKGLNFIIGASGSGKTTLLKIMSGMEQEFEGEVLYCGKSIKNLSEKEKSYFYSRVFGFIWQDFNLLDDLTVLENIMLSQYLKDKIDKKMIVKVLKELKISQLVNQKVKQLSGGQKQRVAIARELIKNPQVIIADEPTSALDEKASETTMEILRDIAKSRTVIVVTHDTSLIDDKSKVYELDKGELISKEEVVNENNKLGKREKYQLSFTNSVVIAKNNIKSKIGRFGMNAISLLIASTLLLVTVSGAITSSSQGVFDELFAAYGEGILDIDVVGSFMSAAGGSEDEPNANVTQDIGGLYNKYLSDKRVKHVVFLQAFNNINVTIDGKEYEVETTNSTPTVNKLTAGVMPSGDGNEVTVSNGFVKKLGITEEEALGKIITFKSDVYNWDSGEPVSKTVSINAKIVGVVDTTVIYEYEGEKMEYTVDDTFFFSKTALDDMRGQADISGDKINFSIRPKTPADMISIKDELNANGIVPIGRFELVEDMVRLNQQTTEQSGSAIIVIGILAIIIIISITIITVLMRKREYAIYKVSGYSKKHISIFTISEFCITFGVSALLFLIASPIINMATTKFWSVNILNSKMLTSGILFVWLMGVLSCVITILIASGTNVANSLKTGDR